MSRGMILRVAAAVDFVLAAFFAESSFLSSRVGRPAALVVAGVLFLGSVTLLTIARRFDHRRA